ncbi:hypothetical protein B0T13DRAFT_477405 [Neurospora crassa]|nr:hypothetical protein B0T13DRAFT_477405 [Neurospora crassa]
MTFLNPVHGLVVPFLCLFTIPMAIFASITSALAFSLLMFRVAIVYVDIAMAFVPQFIKGRHYHSITDGELLTPRRLSSSSTGSVGNRAAGDSEDNSPLAVVSPSPYYTNGYDSHQRSPLRRKSSYGFGTVRRSRRSSQASISPTIASIREDAEMVPPLPETGGLAPSVGIQRDFEGVGGWRLNDSNDDDDAWQNINSRLELPMERCSSFVGRYHHSLSHRSHSAGPSQSLEAGWMGGSTNGRKGTLRSGNGTAGSGHGAEAQTNWHGTGARANKSAFGSISKMALPPADRRNNHRNGNGVSPMGMGMWEKEQEYFAGFPSQNGKWRPTA